MDKQGATAGARLGYMMGCHVAFAGVAARAMLPPWLPGGVAPARSGIRSRPEVSADLTRGDVYVTEDFADDGKCCLVGRLRLVVASASQ